MKERVERVLSLNERRTKGDWRKYQWAGTPICDNHPSQYEGFEGVFGDSLACSIYDPEAKIDGEPKHFSQLICIARNFNNQSFIASAPEMADIIKELYAENQALKAAIENHLKYPPMESKELKEALK